MQNEYTIDLIRRLVAVDSTLPHEEDLALLIADEIRSFGVEPLLEEVSPGRPNVYASIPFGTTDRFLVMSGHSDTVPAVSEWETDPLTLTEYDGRFHGLGVINMKSGLACMLAAFKHFCELPVDHTPKGRLGIAITVDQEGLSIGADALMKTEFGECDAMIHGEHFHGSSKTDYLPSSGTGKILYKLNVTGRAAHALRPHEGGINAIDDAARIITALDQLELKHDSSFGKGTFCTLRIEGGSQTYAVVVPDRCTVLITRLTVPGESREYLLNDMERLIRSLDLKSRVVIETPPPCYESYSLDMNSDIVRVFSDSYESISGAKPVFAPHRGITDANIFTGTGEIPTVVFGPKGGLHHRAGEYVKIDSIIPTTEIYIDTILAYLSPG